MHQQLGLLIFITQSDQTTAPWRRVFQAGERGFGGGEPAVSSADREEEVGWAQGASPASRASAPDGTGSGGAVCSSPGGGAARAGPAPGGPRRELRMLFLRHWTAFTP